MIKIKNLKKLKKFNKRLYLIQNKVISEVVKLDKKLTKRVADKNDLLNDYEIDIRIAFVLKKSNKKYKPTHDNYITQIDEYLKNISKKDLIENWRYGSSNHNEFTFNESHPMFGDYHCWWFHCLYDHKHLSFKKILEIGKILSDIKVYYQYRD